MTKQNLTKFFILAVSILAVPAMSSAATCTKPCCLQADGKATVGKNPAPEQTKESCITGDIGLNVVSQYISRGVIFENQGGIIQPYANLYFKLFEGESFLNKATLNLGIWNTFHSRRTDAGLVNGSGNSSMRSWYEFDFTAGVSLTFAKNFTFTPSYYWFLSPNDGFSTFQGINLKLAYDTTDLLGFNLAPSAQVLFELENKAGSGKDKGIYYEVALAPAFPVGPVTVTLPIAAGFGSDDFYGSARIKRLKDLDADDVVLGIDGDEAAVGLDNENFGYVTAGLNVAYPLPFIPECYGTWTVTAGYSYYHLGEGTSDYNTRIRGGAVRDFDNHEHAFSGGLVVAL